MTVETIESGISAVVAAIPRVIAAAAILMAILPQGAPDRHGTRSGRS